MERLTLPIAGALMGFLLLKGFLKPLKLGLRLAINSGSGLLCLWAINHFSGIPLPITGATVLTTGILGLPGLGLIFLLSLLI